MTIQSTLSKATDSQRALGTLDRQARSQRELVAASLLLCPNDRGARGSR